MLSLRVERPVEGCEVSALAYLNIKGGAMDNATRAKMLEGSPHYFVYRCHFPDSLTGSPHRRQVEPRTGAADVRLLQLSPEGHLRPGALVEVRSGRALPSVRDLREIRP